MGFKKHTLHKPERFLEFDEARKYIEDMNLDRKKTFEAIDYMVNHKEYYFLLKNLVKQFADKETGDRELFDYIFSRLQECPKRKEDAEIYKKIIKSKNKDLKTAFFEYVKNCSKDFNKLAHEFLDDDDKDVRYLGFCILLNIPDEKAKEALKEYILKEGNEDLLKDFLNYIYYYGDKEDIECLEKLKLQFPSKADDIDKIEESL